jgi:hypothetical protein
MCLVQFPLLKSLEFPASEEEAQSFSRINEVLLLIALLPLLAPFDEEPELKTSWKLDPRSSLTRGVIFLSLSDISAPRLLIM